MTSTQRRPRLLVLLGLLGLPGLLAASGLLAACGGSTSTKSSPTTLPPAAPTTAAPTTAAPTTTTVYQPTMPQSTGPGAASRLVSAWSTGDSRGAGAVATPAAVQALFAAPYPRGYIQFRSCGDSPLTCTYANRSAASGAIYNLVVVPAPAGGWYVQSVTVEQ